MKFNDLTAGEIVFGTFRESSDPTHVGLISKDLCNEDLKSDNDELTGLPSFSLYKAENAEVNKTNTMDIPVSYIRINKAAKKRVIIRGSDPFEDQIQALFRLLHRTDDKEAKDIVETLYDEVSFDEMCRALLIVNPGRTYFGQNLTSDNEIYSYFINKNSRCSGLTKKLKSWIQTLIAIEELKYFVKIEEIRKYVIVFKDERDLFEKDDIAELYKEEINIQSLLQYKKALEYLDGKYQSPDKLSIRTMVMEIAKQRLVVRHHLITLKTVSDSFSYLKKAMITRLFTLSTVASRENPAFFSGPKLDDVMQDLGLILDILSSKTLLIETLKDTSNSITYDLKVSAALNIIESVKLREKVLLSDIKDMFRVHAQRDLRGLTTGAIVYVEIDKDSFQNVVHSTKSSGGETQVIVVDAYPNLTQKITEIGEAMKKVLRSDQFVSSVLDSYLAGVPSLKGIGYFGGSLFQLPITDLELLGIILQDNTLKIVIKEASSKFEDLLTKGSLDADFITKFYPVNHFGSRIAEEVVGKLSADMVGYYKSPVLTILDMVSRESFSSGGAALKYDTEPLNIGIFDDVILLDNLLIGFDPTSEAKARVNLGGKAFDVDMNLLLLLKGEATKGANITNEPHLLQLNNRRITMMLTVIDLMKGDKRFTKDIRTSIEREQEQIFQDMLRELFSSSPTLRSLCALASHEIFIDASNMQDEDYYVAKSRLAKKTYNQMGACVLLYVVKLLAIADEVAIAKLISRASITNGLDSNYKDYFGMTN